MAITEKAEKNHEKLFTNHKSTLKVTENYFKTGEKASPGTGKNV